MSYSGRIIYLTKASVYEMILSVVLYR